MAQVAGSTGVGPDVEGLLHQLEHLDRMVLVQLSERGKGLSAPPAFRGRCLDPAYLEAVASGTWSLDDEALLGRVEERMDALALPRVRVLDRRALKTVLRATALAVMTAQLGVPAWEGRRHELAQVWETVVGPLPRRALALLDPA